MMENNSNKNILYFNADGKWEEIGILKNFGIDTLEVETYDNFENELSFEFKMTSKQYKQLLNLLIPYKKVKKGKRYIRVRK